jgi:hypothetical protein
VESITMAEGSEDELAVNGSTQLVIWDKSASGLWDKSACGLRQIAF